MVGIDDWNRALGDPLVCRTLMNHKQGQKGRVIFYLSASIAQATLSSRAHIQLVGVEISVACIDSSFFAVTLFDHLGSSRR